MTLAVLLVVLAQGADGGRAGVAPVGASNAQLEQAFAFLKSRMLPDGGHTFSHPPFHWVVSNIVESIEIPGTVESNGVPVQMHALKVKGARADVYRELLEQFHAQGLYLEEPSEQAQPMKQVQLTALDEERLVSYTAMLDPHPDGTVTVTVGEANLGAGLLNQKRMKQDGYFAPVHPRGGPVTRSRDEGLELLGYSLQGTEAELSEFYRTSLKAKGYVEGPMNAFVRGREQLEVVTRRDGAVVHVLVVKRLLPAK